MERVLWPMEPVEPRMANFFTFFIFADEGASQRVSKSARQLEAAEAEIVLEEEDEPEDGGGEKQGVDAVEDAAVAGEHGAGVFDACAALDGGFEEVAQLGGDVEDGGEEERLPEGLG